MLFVCRDKFTVAVVVGTKFTFNQKLNFLKKYAQLDSVQRARKLQIKSLYVYLICHCVKIENYSILCSI